jgi:hypothetical protein
MQIFDFFGAPLMTSQEVVGMAYLTGTTVA